MTQDRRRLLILAGLAAFALPAPARAVIGKLGAGMMGRLGASAGGGVALQLLSGTVFPRLAGAGTVIGTLSVVRGTGSYTFTFTSNPGSLFQISGSSLQVLNTSIDTGSYPVTIKADNGAGSVVITPWTLIATSEPIPFIF